MHAFCLCIDQHPELVSRFIRFIWQEGDKPTTRLQRLKLFINSQAVIWWVNSATVGSEKLKHFPSMGEGINWFSRHRIESFINCITLISWHNFTVQLCTQKLCSRENDLIVCEPFNWQQTSTSKKGISWETSYSTVNLHFLEILKVSTTYFSTTLDGDPIMLLVQAFGVFFLWGGLTSESSCVFFLPVGKFCHPK